MTRTVTFDTGEMAGARRKYRQAVCEAEALPPGADRRDLEHTLSKLGMFLDEALGGAFSADDHEPKPRRVTVSMAGQTHVLNLDQQEPDDA